MSHIITQIENKPAIVPVTLWPGETVYCPADDADDAAALIKGERGYEPGPNEPEVKRILDLGANVGEFAVWARLRWPYAWCSGVEPDDDKRAICTLNVPPGTQLMKSVSEWQGRADLVRIDARMAEDSDALILAHRAKLVMFDGWAPKTQLLGFKLLSCGMREKHMPFSWWKRE